jgi:hypothetical protein
VNRMSVEVDDVTIALTAGVAESLSIEHADPENPVEISDLRIVVGGTKSSTVPVPTESSGDEDAGPAVWVFDAVQGDDDTWSVPDVLVPVADNRHRLRIVVNGHLEGVGSAEVGTTGRTGPTGVLRVGVGAAGVIRLTAGPAGGGSGVDEEARQAAAAAQESAGAALSGLTAKVDDDDPRLTDPRDPKDHTQAWSTITDKPSFGSAATADVGDFASAAQGAKADVAVPNTRTVNSKALSANVTLTAADVGADQAGSAALALGVARSEISASDQRSGVVGFDPRPLRPQRFRFSRRALRNIVVWGDSVFEGDNGGDQRGFGPSLIDLINNEAPGTRQPGFQAVWGWPGRNWSFTGTWLAVGDLPTAWDASPSIKNATLASMGATDSTAAATWTKPSGMTMTEFDILWTRPTTAASAWSYRLDGGAWVNVPFVSGNPPVLEKITVTGNPTTIDFRAQSSTGTAGKIPCLHGIWPRNGTNGTVVHNWSKSGARLATTLGSTAVSRTTMWRQWFTMYPADLVVFGLTNDSTTNPATAPATAAHMETELQWFTTQNTDVVLVGQIEQNMVDRTFQQAWRDAYKAMALSNGWGYVDAFSRFGTFAAATAAGLMRDNVHPSERGGQLMAAMVARYILNA